ncbi:MAG: cell division protein FtsQ/DivIB [Bacteroidota bacterium]
MKKIKDIKRPELLKGLLWAGLSAVFVVSVGFTDSMSTSQPVSGLEISIIDTTGHSFLTTSDVGDIVSSKFGDVIGKPLSSINMAVLEKYILSNPFVSVVRVFSSIDGKLQIEVVQRDPILRVINFSNESFYIDGEGKYMPASDNYTARVPVVNGYLFNREAEHQVRTIREEEEGTSPEVDRIGQVFEVAKFIRKDPFWRSQVEQLYVAVDGGIELVPRVGNHVVVLGDATALDEKFEKLYLFYTEGLSKTGWNKYKTINLEFEDQVVCTKR